MNIDVRPYLEAMETESWNHVRIESAPGIEISDQARNSLRAGHSTGFMRCAMMILNMKQGEPVRNLLAFRSVKPSLN